MPRLKPCRKADCSQKRGVCRWMRTRGRDWGKCHLPETEHELEPEVRYVMGLSTWRLPEFRFMSWHAVWQEVSLGSRWMCLETAGSYKNTLFNFMTEYVDSSCQTRRLQLSNGGWEFAKRRWKGHEKNECYLWNKWGLFRAVIWNFSCWITPTKNT